MKSLWEVEMAALDVRHLHSPGLVQGDLSQPSLSAQVNQFRQLYSKVINDKHDDVMAKFGAILAQGILDAGKLLFDLLLCHC